MTQKSKSKHKGSLWVLVTLPDGKLPTTAKVSVSRRDKQKSSLSLPYDNHVKHYVSGPLVHGHYQLIVEVKGYVIETVSVRVQGNRQRVNVFPGKKGMKAYYAGRTRIPFKPIKCIGMFLHQGIKKNQLKDLISFCETKLKLKNQQVSKKLAEGRQRFLLFNYGDASDGEVADRLQELNKRDEVHHAGAVLKLGEQNVQLLSNRIIVRFVASVSEGEIQTIAKRLGLTAVAKPKYAGNARIFKSGDPGTYAILNTVEDLSKRDEVDYAEVDCFINLVEDIVPDDPYYDSSTTPASNSNFQWHLPQIRAEDAWDITTGDSSVIIAVCDSGFDPTHEDFSGKVYLSVNLEPSGGIVDAYTAYALDTSHGMAVSGVAAAQGNNTTGISGVAMDCQIMGVNRPAYSLYSYIANMLVWVSGFDPVEVLDESIVYPTPPAPGADVIQNAYGHDGAEMDGIMQDALDFITTYGRSGKGCVVVFSTGNWGEDFVTHASYKRVWAAYEKTIAVGACTQAETHVDYSSYGTAIDLVAPGGDSGGGPYIVSTTQPGYGSFTGYSEGLDYGDRYTKPDASTGQILGTSFSSPQVAGTAALMLSVNADLTWIQVRDMLRETARQIDTANPDPLAQYDADGHSQYYGFGILDCADATQAAQDAIGAGGQDLYARDHVDDDGSVPFDGPVFYHSPDLWCRKTHPDDDDPLDYMNHESPIREQPNYIWGRISNRGADSGDFYVRFYITHFPGAEFLWPDDFIPESPTDEVISLETLERGTYLIGEYVHEGLVAGATDEIWIEWPAALIPPAEVEEDGTPVSWHPCLLMEISPHDSEYNGSIPYHVWDSNDIVQRNISIEDAESGGDSFADAVVLGHNQNTMPFVLLDIDRGNTPAGIELYARYVSDSNREQSLRLLHDPKYAAELVSKKFQLKFESESRVTLWGDGCCRVTAFFPKGGKLEFECCGGFSTFKFAAKPTILDGKPALKLPNQRKVTIPVSIREKKWVPIIIEGRIAPGTHPGIYTIKLIQKQPNGDVSGGCEIELRVK
jgi:subtilisin family serine protease